MAILQSFTNLADNLFNTFNDVVDTVVVIKTTSTTYDPTQGNTTRVEQRFENVLAIRRDFEQQEVGSQVQSGDLEVRIKSNTIAAQVTSNDVIEFSDGSRYSVINPRPVPVKSPIIFRCVCREIRS